MAGRLTKAKSQEIIDNDHDSGGGFTSRMKKVFHGSPILKKKRAQSLHTYIDAKSKTFGVPLNELLAHKKSKTPYKRSLPSSDNFQVEKIPHVVKKIVEHIEEHGLDQEGIYRINGNTKLIEKLKAKFNQYGDADLNDIDIYSVGSLLKLFLRQLPVSLVPDETIDKIVELQESATSGSCSSEYIQSIKLILVSLPEEHYQLLKYLCSHLLKVSTHSDTNKMSSVSLSIVFGPNVCRCGGELTDIKKQGYANAAFAQMIKYNDQIFDKDEEQLKLRTVSETSADEVFIISSPNKSSTPVKKEKPDNPLPYHEHVLQRRHQQAISSSTSWHGSLSHNESFNFSENEQIPHERSIDEAVEASTLKKQQSLSASDVVHKSKSLSASDDAITTRMDPSPYSWKSSPGTTPPTSPVNSPRTSQVYTSLIDDTVQDHLFQSTQSLNQQETSGATSDPPASTHELLKRSNSDIESREATFTRQNKTSRNRKSTVYGNSINEWLKNDNTITQDNTGKITDGMEESDQTRKEKDTNDVKNAIKAFEQKGLVFKPAASVGKLPPQDEATTTNEGSTSLNVVQIPQTVEKHDEKGAESYKNHDFDYVTNRIQTLMHPTLNRAKGPRNRKPRSRKGSTTSSVSSEIAENSSKVTFEESVTVAQSKREKYHDTSWKHVKESNPVVDKSMIDGKELNPTVNEVLSPIPDRLASISSLTSVSTTSRPTSLSSPSHDINQVDTVQRLSPVAEQIQQIAPEDVPTSVSTGWTGKEKEVEKEETKTYKELMEEAKNLKLMIKTFEADFVAKMGHKPSNEDNASIAKEIAALTDIKKRLRALRSSKEKLNNTVPVSKPERTWVSVDDSHPFLSSKEKSKKEATLRRHQSLLVSSIHTHSESPYKQVLEDIMSTISKKREGAERPDQLESMTFEQLLDEKHCVQKLLLQFEKKYGRPQGSDVKITMKPLYDRYRDIKKCLSSHENPQKSSHQTTERLGDTTDNSLCSVTLLQPTAGLTLTEAQETTEPPSTINNMILPKPSKRHRPTQSVPEPLQVHHINSTSNESQRLLTKPKSFSTISEVSTWMTDDQLQAASVSELQHQSMLAHTRKKELRKELQTFETEFLARNKRPVQKEDKKIMYQQYFEYKKMKIRLTQIETLLKSRLQINTIS